jgi:hypothetical protein
MNQMATLDKTINPTFCPLCATAKEQDVYIGESFNELGPKFYCGTILWPFWKQIKVQGEKCRLLQKMRSANIARVSLTFSHPGESLL